jgi:TniQ
MKSTKTPASMIITSIADGEHFPLYPARLRTFACVDLTPDGLIFPSGMRKLIEQFGDLVGPVDTVLARNTLLPLFHRVLDPENQATLVSHFLDEPRYGLPGIVGLNGPRSGWARVKPARCPACIQEDVAPCSNPFWRRDHLIPGLLFCSRHQLPLHIPCDTCADFKAYQNLTTHPGMHCGCGLRPLPQTAKLSNADIASEIEMATAASKLLQPDYLPQLNHIGIAALVEKSTRTLGLVEDSRVNWQRTEAYFKEAPHQQLISRTSLLRGRYQVSTVLCGGGVFRNPVENLALLIALYGTWDAVEAECLSVAAAERAKAAREQSKASRKPRDTTARARWVAKHHDRWFAHYVELYRAMRREHPLDNHSKLLGRLPANAGRFLTRAKLVAAGEDVPSTRFADRSPYDEALDISFTRHIRATAGKLVTEGYRRQITERVLLRGHRMDAAWSQVRKRLPNASKALAECAENRAAHRRRLLMLCKSAEVSSIVGLNKEQVEGMANETVRAFLNPGDTL